MTAWIDQEEERSRLTREALTDLARLHALLAPASPTAAAKVIQALVAPPGALPGNPRTWHTREER